MVDPGQISQVEDVVELGGGGGKVSDNPLVQLYGGSGDGIGKSLQGWGGGEGGQGGGGGGRGWRTCSFTYLMKKA